MNAEILFTIANALALSGWVLLAAFRSWKYTWPLTLVGIISLLSATYVTLFLAYWGSSEGGFGSLAAVMDLFRHPYLVLLGWIHYLVFDLLMGWMISADAERRSVSSIWVLPCLILTFLAGPAGLLAYLLIRWGHTGDYLGRL